MLSYGFECGDLLLYFFVERPASSQGAQDARSASEATLSAASWIFPVRTRCWVAVRPEPPGCPVVGRSGTESGLRDVSTHGQQQAPVPGPQRDAAGWSCRGRSQPHAESSRVDRCGDGSTMGPIIVQATRRTPDWPRLLTVWAGPYDRRQVASGALPFLPRTRQGQFAQGTAMTGNGPRPLRRRCTGLGVGDHPSPLAARRPSRGSLPVAAPDTGRAACRTPRQMAEETCHGRSAGDHGPPLGRLHRR
jgi:hypothetical protein